MRLLQVVLGLLIGLAIAEAVFSVRDDGAFPHLNIYSEDEQLGVRLIPKSSERIRFGGNPVSKVSINAQGYRGIDWPSSPENAIAVVGDSQVFGLGVNNDETFCARMSVMTARPVLNAGVPTYGPPEFLQTARDVVAAYHPKTVVLTINMVNDLFEVQRRNRDRHRVWDGWAVRLETAPAKITHFPGRDWIMGHSHLVYAARRLAYEGGAEQVSSLPSEGSWRDLDALLAAQSDSDGREQRNALATAYTKDVRDSDKAAKELTGLLVQKYGDTADLRPPRANAGDIVGRRFVGESVRTTDLLLDDLVTGAEHFTDWRALVAVSGDTSRRAVEAREALRQKALAENDKDVASAGDALSAAMKKLAETRREPIAFAQVGSPLNAMLQEFIDICHAPDCDPLLLVLPIDVQVAPTEFAKYNLGARDLTAVSALTDRIVRSAALLGIRTVDATSVLRDAEPGAFLQADIHMTPKGHSAVARAVAAELAKPPPLLQATGTLPQGRTRVPTSEEFRRTPVVSLHGHTTDGCEAVVLDEWLRVQCRKTAKLQPVRVTLLHGSRDSFVTWTGDALTLVVPVIAGDTIEAEFIWTEHSQHFTAQRDDDGEIVPTLAAPWQGKFAPEDLSAQAKKLCECTKNVRSLSSCDDVYGATGPECASTYIAGGPSYVQCQSFLECAQGFVASLPTCPPGKTLAGGTMQCVQLCSNDVPCKEGTCVSWANTQVCLGP
jgi:hypothetical protein